MSTRPLTFSSSIGGPPPNYSALPDLVITPNPGIQPLRNVTNTPDPRLTRKIPYPIQLLVSRICGEPPSESNPQTWKRSRPEEERKKTFSRVITPAPDVNRWQTVFKQGIFLLFFHRYEEGIQMIRESYSMHPIPDFFSVLVFECRQATVNSPATLAYIEWGLKCDPHNFDCLFLKGLCDMEAEKYREAKTTFTLLNQLLPADSLVKFLLTNVSDRVTFSKMSIGFLTKQS